MKYLLLTRINPGLPLYEDHSREPQSADVDRQLECLKLDAPKLREQPADLMAQIRANRRAPKQQPGRADPGRTSMAGRQQSQRVEPVSLQGLVPVSVDLRRQELQEKTLTAAKSAQTFVKEREYEELMDQHALQIFMVRHGKIVEESPEYHSFKRLAGPRWEKAQPYLAALLRLVRRSQEKLVRINGSLLLELIASHKKPTYPALLPCVVTGEPGGPSFFAKARSRAAVRLQALARRRLAVRLVRKMKVVLAKVRHLQGWWRAHRLRRAFLAGARGRAEALLGRFEARQARFQEAWAGVKAGGRVEVHYANISGSELKKLCVEKYRSRVALQVGRVFRVVQERAEVVFVTPSEVPEEIRRYYYKVLELAGVPLAALRLHFVHVQGRERLPEHFSVPTQILCSRETVRRIRAVRTAHQAVKGRPAFLVPGLPDKDDVRLSDHLDLPLFAGSPASHALYSKLAFAKAVPHAHAALPGVRLPAPAELQSRLQS